MKNRVLFTTLSSLAALAAGMPAQAQVYINSAQPTPYVNLPNIPGIQNVTSLTFDLPDDGQVSNVPIGFTFNFLGNNFTTLNFGTNGYLTFGSSNSASDLSNVAVGPGGATNYIAPIWDDLRHPAAQNARSGTLGVAPNRIFVIEGGPCSRYPLSAAGDLMYQVWLYEANGRFEYRVGGVNPVNAMSFTSGYEGANSVPAYSPLSCSPNCTTADLGTLSGRTFVTSIAITPELTGSFGAGWTRGAFPGQQAIGPVRIRNLARDTADLVNSEIYLSIDATLDPQDTLVGTVSHPSVFGGGTTVTRNATITVPLGTPDGDYFLLLNVDSTQSFAEADETDNIVASPFHFATAYDLSPTAARSQNGGNPADPIAFDLTIANAGVPYSGSASVEIYASVDQIFDAQDVRVIQTTVTLDGSLSQTVALSGTVPAITPGLYYTVAVVDPSAQVTEFNEANNSFTSAGTFPSGPDLTIASVTIPAQAAPGSMFQVTTILGSVAVPYVGPVGYRLYLSADQRFDAADTLLGTFTESFNGQPNLSSAQTLTMPTNLMGSVFYVVATIDPANTVRELNEMNNAASSATQVLTGSDFRVANVTVTADAQAGQPVTITAQLQSIGLAYTGQVPFRVYFSPNDTFDQADTAVYDGQVFLAGLSQTNINVTFNLPADVFIATYNAIVYIDPNNTLNETDENNNWASSVTTIRLHGAELFCSALDGPDFGFFARPYPISITIENNGEVAANNFQWAIYISDNDIIRITDTQVYLSAPISVPAGAALTLTTTVTLPTYTSTRTMYLGALIDIYSAVGETRESNNTRAIPHPVRVLAPIPDLSGAIVETATAGAAGEQFAITRILRNEGVADAPSFRYAYYLSANPTISTDDILIGEFNLSLPEGGDDYRIDLVNIPPTVAPGRYYVGILLDPAQAVDQVTRANDSIVGAQIDVYAATIRFVTLSLPNATLGVPYETGLFAAGGATALSWSSPMGSLPVGLSLDSASGIISGTPTTEGLSEFTIRASAGTAYADRRFSIRVSAATIPLEVASVSLPPGFAGRPYTATLVAVGGTVPYTFTAVAGAGFPQGLRLDPSGTLSGTPEAPGNYRLLVQVRDAVGASATRSVAFNVVNPNQSLSILQQALKVGTVGLEYSDPDPVALNAAGGIPPYRWSVVGEGVPGLVVTQTGTISGTPELAGEFPLLVRVDDASGLYDTSLFIVEIDSGTELLLSTGELARGTVGVAYTAQLAAIRGTEPYQYSIVNGALPAGIAMTEGGAISGTPTAAGVYSFVAVVQDAKRRTDVRPLSIIVAAPPSQMMTNSSGGCGCSTSTKSSAEPLVFFLAAAALFAFRRRVQGWWALPVVLVLVAGIGLPAYAQTQVPGTPYLMTRRAQPYGALTGGTVIFAPGSSSGRVSTIQLPFPFKYYDRTYSSVSVSGYGVLAMGSVATISYVPSAPGSSTTNLNGFIAPFWEDMDIGGPIRWEVLGTAPQRTFVVEWAGLELWATGEPGFNFQVRMFEGISGRIQVRYGPMNQTTTESAAAVMGMEDADGRRPVLFDGTAPACTSGCTVSDYTGMANTEVELVQDPGVELVAVDVVAPAFGYLGTPMNVSALIANAHSRTLGPFSYQIYANRTRSMTGATLLYTSGGVTFPAFNQNTVVAPVVPQGLVQGEYYLLLSVDSGGAVAEVDEANNVVASQGRVRILEGKPDLVVESVSLSTQQANAGDNLTIYAKVANRGSDPASAAAAVLLSSNPAISPQDGELTRFNVSLAAGESVTATQTFQLPAGTNSGSYYVGVYADVAGTVEELSESNNGRAAFSPLAVTGTGLAITTSRLPAAITGSAYSGLLAATGGSGGYLWEIRSGRLPHNIGLVAATGELFGRAIEPGTQTFTVRVTSAGSSTERMLSLSVASPDAPLTIVSRSLPVGVIGVEYAFSLSSTGGVRTATPTWSASGLPPGLSLSPEGNLTGIPEGVANATIAVSLTDGTTTATRDLLLTIRENNALLIRPAMLSNATYQTGYSAGLEASGGVPPYSWTLESGSLPAGISLDTSGMISGTPTQVGTYRFVVKARDSATGGLSAVDLGTFEILVEGGGGFSITTASLPGGNVGSGYDVTIETMGGGAPYVWRISEGRLPPGVDSELNPETGRFRIVGTPTEIGTANILVEVIEASGRVATKAFTLDVQAAIPVPTTPTETKGGGCSCDASSRSPGGLLALAALLLFWRRRR